MRHALCLLAAASLATAQTEPQLPALEPSDFALMPWWIIPNSPEMYQSVRDCGFNLTMLAEADALDNVQAAGLRAFVTGPGTHVGDAEAGLPDDEIAKRVQALVEATAAHPATYGFYLRDEPSAAAFEGLGRWVKAYAKAAPGKVPYINLFPNYASPDQLAAKDYTEYLDRFVELAHPHYISYDHYAMMEDGSLRGGYFENLEAVRAAGLRHNLPYWNIVLSNAHFSYAEPSPATLRFQAFTSLAYGVRGLAYFTYLAPSVGNYRLAPIDQYGHKTATWDMLREVNWQLRFLLPTYIRYTSRAVYHLSDPPPGCSGPDGRTLPLVAAGNNLLVGEFNGPDGGSAIVVVNKSLTRSTYFTVTAEQPGELRLISPFNGQAIHFAGEQQYLAPGQGSLLTFAPAK